MTTTTVSPAMSRTIRALDASAWDASGRPRPGVVAEVAERLLYVVAGASYPAVGRGDVQAAQSLEDLAGVLRPDGELADGEAARLLAGLVELRAAADDEQVVAALGEVP